MSILDIAGCGSRGRTYASLASKMPERFLLVAVADLVKEDFASF